MQELIVLFQSDPFTLTAYGLGAAVAYLLGCLLCWVNVKKPFWLCLSLPFGALLGSRLVYCLANLANILADYGGISFFWQIQRGGFSLAGAILGALPVLMIAARLRGEKLSGLLRHLLPSLFIVLTVMRLCEYFTPEGVGRWLDAETPVFPFTVWSELQYGVVIPVFLWEAIVAMLGLLYCQICIRKEETLSLGLGWLFATQIVLESLRGDSFLRFGFVRFHQLASVVGLLCLLCRNLACGKPARREKILRILLFSVAVLGAVGIEFALDRTNVPHGLLYALLTLAASVMFLSCAFFPKKKKS